MQVDGSAAAAPGALEAAKRSLDVLAVVGLTEDMKGFQRALAARWPLAFGKGGCPIPSGATAKNPTNTRPPGSAPAELDAPTRAAIAAANQLDAQLYAHAQQLAARQLPASS